MLVGFGIVLMLLGVFGCIFNNGETRGQRNQSRAAAYIAISTGFWITIAGLLWECL